MQPGVPGLGVAPDLARGRLQPGRLERCGQPAARGLRRGFDGDDAAVLAGRLLRRAGHGERLAGAAAAARLGEGQPGDDARDLGVAVEQVAPPGIGHIGLRQRQHADLSLVIEHRPQHLPARFMGGDRGQAAEMVARQLPAAGAMAGALDGDGEGSLQPQQRRDQLAPKPHQDGLGQRAFMAGDQPAQHDRLAPRPQEDRRRPARGIALQLADALGDLRPPDQQVVERIVDAVDLAAQVVERIVGGSHVGRAVSGSGQ